jgi:hypothetical protein
MKLRTRFNKQSVLISIAIVAMVSLASMPLVAKSRMAFYGFEITMPEEVTAVPGETVEVEGEILVTGFYWLHNFDMTVTGSPYEYEIEPEWWEHVRILRDWNPDDGLFRVPETFSLSIDVPEDATGSYIITVEGQEHHSFREISNFTYFVLRTEGEPIKPQLSISDILVPEKIKEFEPFQLTFRLNNDGPVDTVATVAVVVPEDWQVDEPSQDITVESGESAASAFSIIPTTTPGDVSLLVEYPFKEEVITFTKAGPYLLPAGATTTTEFEGNVSEPILSQLIGYASVLLESVTKGFEGFAGPYATSIIMGIIFVLFVIIVWLVFDIVKFVKGRGAKEPEEVKEKTKGVEASDSVIDLSDSVSSINGVQIKEV